MSPLENKPLIAMPEVARLVDLTYRHHDLSRQVEPPAWDHLAHAAWEDERDDLQCDVELLKEELAVLFKEWEE